ncbi:MAG: HAD hydrolase-like protein [Pseudomonadota bacterium]
MNDAVIQPEEKRGRLAIFDWNGTLFDDMSATHIATNKSLAFFGKDPITIEQEQEIFTFPLIHFYEKMGVPVDAYLEHAEEVSDLFHATYQEESIHCGLAKDVTPLLQWLNDQSVTCMILSNHRQATLEQDVKRFKIDHFFHTISGNENPATIIRGMNKQERLENYMQSHGFASESSFIIGDSHEEPEIAHRLGLMGISISGGLLSPTRLQKYKKDYVIDCMSELPPILEKEWNLPSFNG